MFIPRKQPRRRIALPALVAVKTLDGDPWEVPARTFDFSPLGVGLFAAESLPPGLPVRVEIEERGEGLRRVRCWAGRVVSVRVTRSQFRIGVAFLDPEGGPTSRLHAPRRRRPEAVVRIDPAWSNEDQAAEPDATSADAEAPQARPGMLGLFRAVAVLGFLADQLGKSRGPAVRNFGALGGLMLGGPKVHQVLAMATLLLTGGIARMALRDRARWGVLDAIGWGGLLAGMIGNTVDRLALGYVRDVLRSGLFPGWAFNLVDAMAIGGVACLLLARAIGRPGLPATVPSAATAHAVTSVR